MPTLCIISDTHGLHDSVKVPPRGDVLIHCGDSTDDIGQAALRSFLIWFERQPQKRKILIAGNHCGAFQLWPDLARAMVKEVAPSVTYLQDSGIEIDGIKYWGSPYTPTFFDWYFMRDRGADIRRHWDMIPDDTDVLITHGPAYGCLDESGYSEGAERNPKVGCRDLYEAVLRVQPKVHAFGHIHHSYGAKPLIHDNGTKTILMNASCCNEAYKPINLPWVIEL